MPTEWVRATVFPWTTTGSTTTGYYPWPWPASNSTTITWASQNTYNVWPTDVRGAVWDGWVTIHEKVMRTAEQEQALADQRQRQREERSRLLLAAQVRMEGAQERALELLEMILTAEEKVWRDQHPDEILVRGSDGGMFLISQYGVHGNISEVDEHGCVLGRICVAPAMYDRQADAPLPLADGWVGQYLAIKHSEAEVRARGNWSSRRDCQQPNVPILRAA